MKVHHQFTRGFWDHHETTSLSLSCKRLRPLAPKLTVTTAAATVDLKSFIRPDSGPRKLAPPPSSDVKKDSLQAETHPGGTRWNPTQEQIGILEMLYCRGMRTPNAQQIEQITVQLSKYGKIEGKNVFYWFQNHKARERQKQKRNVLGLSHAPRTTSFLSAAAFSSTTNSVTFSFDTAKEESRREEQTLSKRKCRSWAFENYIEESSCNHNNKLANSKGNIEGEDEEEGVKKTLELFPLHPEGR